MDFMKELFRFNYISAYCLPSVINDIDEEIENLLAFFHHLHKTDAYAVKCHRVLVLNRTIDNRAITQCIS